MAAPGRIAGRARSSTTQPPKRCSIADAPFLISSGRVAFVGHNPGLGELAVALAGAGPHPDLKRMAVKFPTGAVAALDFQVRHWRELERNSAMLALFLTPSELEADPD